MIRATPPISLADVMAELRVTNPGRAYPISLGDTDVRALAGKPSGPVSLGDLYGKSSYTPMLIQAQGGYDFQDADIGPGTATATAIASVSGGLGAKTYAWNIISSSGSPVLSGQNSSILSASKPYSRYSQGFVSVDASCTVTDSTGAKVTSSTVSITLEWTSSV